MMHCCRKLIHSGAVLDVCFGHFWESHGVNVVLLKDCLLECRNLEFHETPTGERHWLNYCRQQTLTERAHVIKTLHPAQGTIQKDNDLLAMLTSQDCVIVLRYDHDRQLFIPIMQSCLKSALAASIIDDPSTSNGMDCVDMVPNATYLSVCEETGDMVVASDSSRQFAVIRYPSGHVRCGRLPSSIMSILSVRFFARNPATKSHYLSFLIKTEEDHLVCIYDCHRGDDEALCKSAIDLTLTMPIPISSVWNKDFGVWNQDHGPPRALLPIPQHPFGAMLVCRRAVCILDFHVLYSERKTKELEVKHIAMMWPAAGPVHHNRVPVQLVREFLFERHSCCGEDVSLASEKPRGHLHENALHRILSFDYGIRQEEKCLDDMWRKASLRLCLDDGVIKTIHVTFQRSQSHTEWRTLLKGVVHGTPCLSPGHRLCCLPRGNLFFYSFNLDHFLLSPLHKGSDIQYQRTQILENSGSIRDLLIRRNADNETGRVFYTASPDESAASVKIMSSGIMTEDLCLSPQFKCLTRLWKIRPSNRLQSREFIVASFLDETRILIFKDGVFIDGTHLMGILRNEPTIHCAALNHSFFVQVTPSRVALCAMRMSEDNKTEKPSLHNKHISSSSLATDEMDCEATPRRWSFSNFNAQQLSSVLKFSEKSTTSGSEGPESIWYSTAQRDLPNGHDGSSLTPRGFLDLTFWGRKPEKNTRLEHIMCAAAFDEAVCLFSSTTSSLILLELEDVLQHGLSHQPRKRSRSTVRLKTLLSAETEDMHPSCMILTVDGTTGKMLCIMGTYSSSIEVFLLCTSKKSCWHLWSIKGEDLYDGSQLNIECSALDATRFDRQELPVPESIVVMGHSDKQCTPCLLVGFRNGVLGEYSVHEGWKGASMRRMMQVGVLPVHLEQIRPDLVLAYSNRSFLLRMNVPRPSTSITCCCQIGTIKQINLPSHIKCCTVLTTASDLMLWREDEKKSAIELPEILEYCCNGERMRYLFVYADVNGMLHMANIPRQIQSITTDQPIEKLIQLPRRHQILGISKLSGIYLIDIRQRTLHLCYKAKPEEFVSAASLWSTSGSSSTTAADLPLSETTRNDRDREDISAAERSDFRIRNYMKTVRDVSTPRCPEGDLLPSWPVFTADTILLAVGTGKETCSDVSLEAVERGTLRLLRIKISEEDHGLQSRMSQLAFRRLPDPVSCLAPFNESVLMVGVGSRLVPYHIHNGRWEKSPNWLPIRDPATAIHVCRSTVATGDDFNSVILYKFTHPQTPSFPDKLEHVGSGKHARGIVDIHMNRDGRIAAIDNRGNVIFFTSTLEAPASSEKNLKEGLAIPLKTHLTALRSTDALNGVSEYVQCLFEDHHREEEEDGHTFVVSSELGTIYCVAQMSSDVSPKLHKRLIGTNRESATDERPHMEQCQEYDDEQHASYLTFCFS